MLKKASWLPLVGVIFMALNSCSSHEEPFLNIQICVVDKQGVERFKSTMRAIAKSENLAFIDNSAQQGNDLKTMGADKLLKRDAALAIDVHIEGAGGMGVTAGNLGLPPYQVVLGFTAGSDAAKAHRLSDRLAKALSQWWHIETVPQGKGAFPMESCKDSAPGAGEGPKTSKAR